MTSFPRDANKHASAFSFQDTEEVKNTTEGSDITGGCSKPHDEEHEQRSAPDKKLLGAPGIATRSKDATRGSWPYC